MAEHVKSTNNCGFDVSSRPTVRLLPFDEQDHKLPDKTYTLHFDVNVYAHMESIKIDTVPTMVIQDMEFRDCTFHMYDTVIKGLPTGETDQEEDYIMSIEAAMQGALKRYIYDNSMVKEELTVGSYIKYKQMISPYVHFVRLAGYVKLEVQF